MHMYVYITANPQQSLRVTIGGVYPIMLFALPLFLHIPCLKFPWHPTHAIDIPILDAHL